MTKDKVAYVCNECGYDSSKWMGRCPACQSWNSMVEFKIPARAVGGKS
ncbi:MAG TPA: DNA repair protein RadA, partial [Firmicutes bacterium]|nr:DNA repair protein RadA [Bacillota bacterium]HBR24612.1 DNA repair protein RadA [Bacillota bacterium]HCF91828.1 DNA repair protein RadA [Bacillota bacterium]HCM16838.1 DNA repair protein RadA [Bacillota bacterium]HCX71659.1 DNA repair protein RadA [Bacillota bacterium]